MFGQYSRYSQTLTKGELVAGALAAHPGITIKESRLAAKNTLRYIDDKGVERIRLHKTDILEFRPNGEIHVSTGGWNSVTTRARLRDFGRGKVSAETSKGILHINGVEIRESCRILKNGTVKSDTTPEKNAKLVKLIDAYMAKLKKQGLPKAEDSGGDPWVFDRVSEATMLDWLKTGYVFRLMFALAARHAGAKEMGIAWDLQDIDKRGGKLDSFQSRRVRRFIRFCVGLES